jgi:hypothetical protein
MACGPWFRGGNIPEMDCRIKAETATKSRRRTAAQRQEIAKPTPPADFFAATQRFSKEQPHAK